MSGVLFGVGVGPGDPELMTLKAARLISGADHIAYPAPDSGDSFARTIAVEFFAENVVEIPIIVPMKIARFPAEEIYDEAAGTIAALLDEGHDVVVLCEGDPFFYGSFMYLYQRLAACYTVEIVPGVSSPMASAAQLGRPLAARNDVLSIVPAPLERDDLRARIEASDAVVLIKIGRHFAKVCAVIEELGLTGNAAYIERATLPSEKAMPLAEVSETVAPYFSIILIYKGQESWVV